MKKAIIVLGTSATLFAVMLGSLALYVYNLDLGVYYKGRAKLDYNWKYYFTKCPKEEYQFDGKLFSFSYPRFSSKNPMREKEGWIAFDENLLDIDWDKNIPASILAELSAHLSYGGTNFPVFSVEFMQWVLLESDKAYLDSDKIYDKQLKQINFRNGGSAILISLLSKTEHRPHSKYLIGITPGGYVFKIRSIVQLNTSEESYRELTFGHFQTCTVYPDPSRDARSACALSRFLQTFELKN